MKEAIKSTGIGTEISHTHLTSSAFTSKVFGKGPLGLTLLIYTRKVPFRILQLITRSGRGGLKCAIYNKLQTEVVEIMTFSHNKSRAYPHQIGRRFYEMKLRIVRGPEGPEVQSRFYE